MRQSRISLPEAPEPIQQNLFGATGVTAGEHDPFPEVLRDEIGFGRVIATTLNGGGKALGLDFEFNPRTGKPSITGIASRKPLACSLPWDLHQATHLVDFCEKNDIKLVGHNAISTEKVLLEKNLGRELPLDLFDDSMLSHFLLNQDFCRGTEKSEEEAGSYGFMGLWTMASMCTNLPVWKSCRGRACEGPCPRCSVFEYCAIDSYASVEGHYVMQQQMAEYHVPHSLYRELLELADICHKMEVRGIRVDLAYVQQLNKEMDAAKENLFPFELVGKHREYKEFNPRSADQVTKWFTHRGIRLGSTDKKYILKVLEKQGTKTGHSDITSYLDYLQENPPENEPLKQLYDLYQFKSSGKGLDSWFNDKYLTGDMIHPRFICTGSSMNRLSSSKPNFQNLPSSRGWGKKIKACVIPRDESLDFLETDLSQMELRACLFLAGVDPSTIGTDAFQWLVDNGGGAFEKAQALMPGFSARDVAKSVSHAGDYLEGLRIFSPQELETARYKREIFDGALKIYPDWTFRGGIVGFTGTNLAERFFGSRTDLNRKKALEIQEMYFGKFPILRQWHRKVLASIEDSGYVQDTTGRFLRLYGTNEEDCKMAAAFYGQGSGAIHVQGVMINYWRNSKVVPVIQCHDSLLFEIPKEWTNKKAIDFLQPMFQDTWRLEGFACPGKIKRGRSYGELIEINA